MRATGCVSVGGKSFSLFITFLVLTSAISERLLGAKFPHRRNSIEKMRIDEKGRPRPHPHYIKSRMGPTSGVILLRESTLPRNLTMLRPAQAPVPIRSKTGNFPVYRPPPSPHHPVMKKCKGRKNLLDDIGLLSLFTAVTASSFGLYTVIVNSMTSNNIGIISGLFSILIWLPSSLLSLSNLSGDLASFLGNYLNSLSFINSMYGFMGVLFGTADVLASSVGETVGLISLVLSVVATFPEWLDSIIEFLYRVGNRPHLEYYVENYGCGVPGIFHLGQGGSTLYDRINQALVQMTNMKGAM